MKYPILEAGQTPDPGKTYTLIESFFQHVEIVDDPFEVVEVVDESTGSKTIIEKRVKDGPMRIRGVFQYENKKNANRRVYPRGLWERHTRPDADLMKRIRERMVVGQIEHPESGVGKLDESAIIVTGLSLGKDEKDGARPVIGEAEILDTPKGRVVRDLIRCNVKVGVSSRGSGTVDARGIVDERTYRPVTWDIVGNPSTPNAFPDVVESLAESGDGGLQTRVRVSYIREAGRVRTRFIDESTSAVLMEFDSPDEETNTSHGSRSTVMDIRQQFEALRSTIEMQLEVDPSICNEAQLRELGKNLRAQLVTLGSMAEDDKGLQPAARDMESRINTFTNKIDSMLEAMRAADTQDDGDTGRVSESVDDDDLEGVDEDDYGDDEFEVDENDLSPDDARALLTRARDAITELRDELEASESLNEALAEQLAAVEEERNDLAESLAGSYVLLGELTSVRELDGAEEVAEAVASLLEANPDLEPLQGVLRRCRTLDEVHTFAAKVKHPSGRPRTGLPPLSERHNSGASQDINERTGASDNGGRRDVAMLRKLEETRRKRQGTPVNEG